MLRFLGLVAFIFILSQALIFTTVVFSDKSSDPTPAASSQFAARSEVTADEDGNIWGEIWPIVLFIEGCCLATAYAISYLISSRFPSRF